jgi:GH35 family endo-1,4-beta-xylanase
MLEAGANMKSVLLSLGLWLVVGSTAWPQTTQLNADSLALQPTGTTTGTSVILDRDGYLGTYITLAAPGDVTINVQARGTASGGVDPNLNIVVADAKAGFDVAPGVGSYSHKFSLPAGTFFVRTEFNNDVAATPRQLQIDKLTVTGATVSNTNSDANALAASDTYIANYRRGTVRIGGFTPGATVNVSMKKLGFHLGAGLDATTHTALVGTNANSQAFQAIVNQNFNTLVASDEIWDSTEATRGQPTMESADQLFAYAKAHNMTARLHNMLWDGQQPAWVNTLLASAGGGNASAKTDLRNAISSRIGYFVGDGPGHNPDRATQYAEMDLYNESYNNGQQGGPNTYWNIYGPAGVAAIYAEANQAARNAGSTAKMFVNEYSGLSGDRNGQGWATQGFLQNIEAIRSAGSGEVIGGIGLEYYLNSAAEHSPSTFMSSLQSFNVEGIPEQLSEFGIIGSVTDSDATKIMNESLRLTFGNPNSEGFINWYPFQESDEPPSFAPNGGLYRGSTSDWAAMQLTAAGAAWQNLLAQWNTQLTATADASGAIHFNGYFGDYELTAAGKSYDLSLIKGAANFSIGASVGDYNGDGLVNAADYTVWRDTLGSATDLRADGNGNGIIDAGDCNTWTTHFGQSFSGGGSAAVPEPGALVLAALAIALVTGAAATPPLFKMRAKRMSKDLQTGDPAV